MKTETDTFQPLTGHFRERVLLFAALQREMHVHFPLASDHKMMDNPEGKVALPALATTANMAAAPPPNKQTNRRSFRVIYVI